MKTEDSEYRLDISENGDGSITIELEGVVGFSTVESILSKVEGAIKRHSGGEITLRMDNVRYFDSAGTAMLLKIHRELGKRRIAFKMGEVSREVSEFLRLINFEKLLKPEAFSVHIPRNFFEMLGEMIIEIERDLRRMTLFIGKFTLSMLWNLRHPGRTRWREVVFLTQRAGAEAFPIVALLSLLIGLVTAFSSAVQLRQFGANIFIADLVGIGMTRELGPLITAIILTGRSGSAFAAEIGTMQISDEIDALTVMGIKPLQYLVLPRILAVMLAMPFLTLFSDFFGVLGGLIISMLSLNLTLTAFLNQLELAIDLWDVFSGVLKAFVFGILVAGVGCYRGLETRGGALGVGQSTTSSVVSGIFLIVVADSAFAILFHYLGL